MTKPKRKPKKSAVVRQRHDPPDVGKVAIGSAVGAAMGALMGAAFVRRPNLFNELMEQFGGLITNPAFLSTIQGMAAPVGVKIEAAPAPHPPGGCGTPGCPSNNPHAVEEEEARVSQENPTWTHTQVAAEVYRRIDDQMERAHRAAYEQRRAARPRSKKKKNSTTNPEETSN